MLGRFLGRLAGGNEAAVPRVSTAATEPIATARLWSFIWGFLSIR